MNLNLPFDRDNIIKDYEAELKGARQWARIIGSLHVISQFLAFCNLTSATVALLGAFLENLAPRDFAFITCLLFIEAGRLASVSSFLSFLMRPLFHGSQDPKNINHDQDDQYPTSQLVRLSSNCVQCLLIVPGFVIPVIGHVLLDHYSETRNLRSSLRIFYSFVSLNSLVALVNLVYSDRAFRALNKPPEQSVLIDSAGTSYRSPAEQSVLRYFDTVLENAILNRGLVKADLFDFFNFAYTMLGDEYRRDVQPEAVAKNHKRLIQYLYAHRLGSDALMVYLEAEDPFVQLAAVNMVGFWSDRTWGVGVPEEELSKLPAELLTKLADKIGTGQVGWAATNSFGVLAETPKGASKVAGIRTGCSNIGLPDHLANLLDDSSTRSLATVRTLVYIYEQWSVRKPDEEASSRPPFQTSTDLVSKLEKLAKEAKVHRLRMYAAYLLLLLKRRCNRTVVLAIDPGADTYWFSTEVSMLEFLRAQIPDAPPFHPPKFCNPDPKYPDRPRKPFVIRPGRKITTPSWANGLELITIEN